MRGKLPQTCSLAIVMTEAAIHDAIKASLVLSVKAVEKSCGFGNDLWFDYVNAFSHKEDGFASVTRDPARYSAAFLGDFLQYAGQKCKDSEAVASFISRKRLKVERPSRTAESFRTRDSTPVEAVWIVVGEEVLGGAALACPCREVALPSEVIHHSGVAVAMVLSSIASGLVTRRLGVTLKHPLQYGCIHFEGKFVQWPKKHDQKACHDRIDNLNHSFRAFGVDGRATRSVSGGTVRSNLHPGLTHFVGVGVTTGGTRPCFQIEPNQYLKHLAMEQKNVLYDGSMVEHLVQARRGYPNGISTWDAKQGSCVVTDVLQYHNLNDSSTLVLVLSPRGVLLEIPCTFERADPQDIWATSRT